MGAVGYAWPNGRVPGLQGRTVHACYGGPVARVQELPTRTDAQFRAAGRASARSVAAGRRPGPVAPGSDPRLARSAKRADRDGGAAGAAGYAWPNGRVRPELRSRQAGSHGADRDHDRGAVPPGPAAAAGSAPVHGGTYINV